MGWYCTYLSLALLPSSVRERRSEHNDQVSQEVELSDSLGLEVISKFQSLSCLLGPYVHGQDYGVSVPVGLVNGVCDLFNLALYNLFMAGKLQRDVVALLLAS
jgi:hypothetical protein